MSVKYKEGREIFCKMCLLHVNFYNWIHGAPKKTVITISRITSEVLFWSWPNFIHIMIVLCAQHPPVSKFLAKKLGFVLALEDVIQSTVSFVAVCDNQHRVACPGAWRVLDSVWSTERGRQGHPVVRTGWRQRHTSNDLLAWLRQRFPDRLISRRCDPEWSPHSPNLNSPDFYLWGTWRIRCRTAAHRPFLPWRQPSQHP